MNHAAPLGTRLLPGMHMNANPPPLPRPRGAGKSTVRCRNEFQRGVCVCRFVTRDSLGAPLRGRPVAAAGSCCSPGLFLLDPCFLLHPDADFWGLSFPYSFQSWDKSPHFLHSLHFGHSLHFSESDSVMGKHDYLCLETVCLSFPTCILGRAPSLGD